MIRIEEGYINQESIVTEGFDNGSYYNYKLYELLLTEDKLNEWISNNPILSTYDFLDGFYSYMLNVIENEFLSDAMKSNVLEYLNLIRFNEDRRIASLDSKSFKERVGLINKLIRLVNSAKGTHYVSFYRNELYKRTNNEMYLLDAIDSKKEEALFESMKFDQFVIYSHSDAISEEEFIKNYAIDLTKDFKYFQTINCILKEYPEQFNNPLFKRRYNIIINIFLNYNMKNSQVSSSIIVFDHKVKTIIKSNSIIRTSAKIGNI